MSAIVHLVAVPYYLFALQNSLASSVRTLFPWQELSMVAAASAGGGLAGWAVRSSFSTAGIPLQLPLTIVVFASVTWCFLSRFGLVNTNGILGRIHAIVFGKA